MTDGGTNGRRVIADRFALWPMGRRSLRQQAHKAARAGRRSVVEPHCSALEKMLVNPVIDGAGPAGRDDQWEGVLGADGQFPAAALKGAGGRHAGRRPGLRSVPCWREGRRGH